MNDPIEQLTDDQRKALLVIHRKGPGTNANLSYKKIADKLGMSDRTLREWRKLPAFREAMSDMPAEQVRNALFDQAVLKGDVQAMKEWLKRYDDAPLDDPVDDLLNMTAAQYEEIRRNIFLEYKMGGAGTMVG